MRHKTIDTLRRQRSQQKLEQLQSEHELQCGQVSAGDIENSVTQGRLMARLSPEHREALTLTKFIGLSTAEAARQLQISEGAVKVRVHRAIASLTRLLEADA